MYIFFSGVFIFGGPCLKNSGSNLTVTFFVKIMFLKIDTFFQKNLHINSTYYQYVDHISGNESMVGLIEVPIDRSHPDAQSVNFP